ncbi:conserved hypothetical protein [Gammaproteobacteria bacterium]
MHNEKLIQLLLDILNFRTEQTGAAIEITRLTDLSSKEWSSLLTLAKGQGISPLFFHRLKKRGLQSAVPPELWKKLNQGYLYNVARNLRLYAELDQIVQWLNAEQIPVIPLKGMYLAQVVYQNIGLRLIGDLDLLVPQDKAQHSWELLQQRGYHVSTNTTLCSHLQPLYKESTAPVEIHDGLYEFDVDFTMDAQEIWQRAHPIQLGKTKVFGMTPEDLLLHLSEHLSYKHYFSFGLRPIYDIILTIEHFGNHLDWNQICERAERWGWSKGVYLSLRLAQEIGNTHLSEAAWKQLGRNNDEETIQTMLKIARNQIFANSSANISLPRKVVNVWQAGSLIEAAKNFYHGIILPEEIMTTMYPFDSTSPKRYWYYLKRLIHVLRNHAPTAWQLLRGNPIVTTAAQRESLLLNWMNGKPISSSKAR